jgi:hypothetical protein
MKESKLTFAEGFLRIQAEDARKNGNKMKTFDWDKAAQIMHTISEGNNIKELDFGYRVNSSLFEGVSVNVFNLNENIYIQKINKFHSYSLRFYVLPFYPDLPPLQLY